jgi:hypothetical protein
MQTQIWPIHYHWVGANFGNCCQSIVFLEFSRRQLPNTRWVRGWLIVLVISVSLFRCFSQCALANCVLHKHSVLRDEAKEWERNENRPILCQCCSNWCSPLWGQKVSITKPYDQLLCTAAVGRDRNSRVLENNTQLTSPKKEHSLVHKT